MDQQEAGGIVVTAIPILEGLNWRISKTLRPAVAAGHLSMTQNELAAFHEARGMTILCPWR